MTFPTTLDTITDGSTVIVANHIKNLQNLLVGPAWINIKGAPYNAVGDGVADDSAAIQAALNAVPVGGGNVYFPPGTYKLMSTLQIKQSGTQVYTSGAHTVLLAGTTNLKLLYAQNLSYIWIGDVFLDGGWQTGVSGIYFDGVLNSRLGIIWADRFTGNTNACAALVLTCTAGATQNCGRNVIQSLMVLNCGRAIILGGTVTRLVPNNSFFYVEANGRNDLAAPLIDFQAYCDSNMFVYVDLTVNISGGSCVTYNSGVPGSNNGVYECHFLKAICAGTVAGATTVIVNKTERMSYMQFRSGTTSATSPNPTINTGGLLGLLPGSRSATDTDFNQTGGPVGVQMVGAASGGIPVVSPAGIDTNSHLSVQGKGTGILLLGNNQTNYVQLQSQTTGNAPILAASGDANLNLKLAGNGTGAVELVNHLASSVAGTPTTTNKGANVTSVTFTGNDTRGSIAIVMAGALAANTRIATCTYAITYGTAPGLVLLVSETSGAGLVIVNFYSGAESATAFDLFCEQALATGTYTVKYIIIG